MNTPTEQVPEPKKETQEPKRSWFVPVVLAIFVGLFIFSLIWPAIQNNRLIAHRLICGMNLSSLGKAMRMYRDDYGRYPTPEKWCDLLLGQGNVSEGMFKCPGNKKQRCSYALNPNVTVNSAGDVVVLFETKGGWNRVGGAELITSENHMWSGSDGSKHEGCGCNVFFNDGHTEFVKARDVEELKWEMQEEPKVGAEDVQSERR